MVKILGTSEAKKPDHPKKDTMFGDFAFFRQPCSPGDAAATVPAGIPRSAAIMIRVILCVFIVPPTAKKSAP
jgi:hypothetical protein